MKYRHKTIGTILEPRTELAEAQLAKSEDYEVVKERKPRKVAEDEEVQER